RHDTHRTRTVRGLARSNLSADPGRPFSAPLVTSLACPACVGPLPAGQCYPWGWPLIGRPARELPTHSGRVWMSPARNATQRSTASISRRQFFQAGIGALAMGVPGTVAAGVDANRGLRGVAAEKSCIFVLLCGGPSHLDTWDLKPAAPADIRGPYRPVATQVPGMRISELHTRLASLTAHICLIRSM